MSSPLKKEFEYYLANQDEMVEKYNGKYIVIKDEKIIGTFDDELTAINATQKFHQLGTFMVHLVSPGEAGHTVYLTPSALHLRCFPGLFKAGIKSL